MIDSDVNLADYAARRGRAESIDEEEDDEAYHFIAYVHVGDALWELDGLKRQPVKLRKVNSVEIHIICTNHSTDACTKDDWVALAGPHIQHRIARYPEGELRFTLLAVVPDRVCGLRQALRTNELTLGLIEEQMSEVNLHWKERVPYSGLNHTTLTKEPTEWKDDLNPKIVDGVMAKTDLNDLWTGFQDLVRQQQEIKTDIRTQQDRLNCYKSLAEDRRQDYSAFVEGFAHILAEKRLPGVLLT